MVESSFSSGDISYVLSIQWKHQLNSSQRVHHRTSGFTTHQCRILLDGCLGNRQTIHMEAWRTSLNQSGSHGPTRQRSAAADWTHRKGRARSCVGAEQPSRKKDPPTPRRDRPYQNPRVPARGIRARRRVEETSSYNAALADCRTSERGPSSSPREATGPSRAPRRRRRLQQRCTACLLDSLLRGSRALACVWLQFRRARECAIAPKSSSAPGTTNLQRPRCWAPRLGRAS